MAAFLVQWHSRATVKQRERREETESGGEIERQRFGRNPVCPRAPPFCFVCFSTLCRLLMKRREQPDNCEPLGYNLKSVDSRPPFCEVSRK